MRSALLLLLTVLPCVAFASHIEINLYPENPTIFQDDFIGNAGTIWEEEIKGPLFKSMYKIKNVSNSPLIIYGVTYFVFSGEDVLTRQSNTKLVSEFVSVGEEFVPEYDIYFGSLPKFTKTEGISYQYYVEVSYIETINNTWRTFHTPVLDLKH